MAARRYLWVWALLLLVSLPASLRAQEPAPADTRTVYLVTMYPGDALFTGFGHIAIRIRDSATGEDDVFDYGTYEAEDPALGWKFLVGTLPYYCQHTSFGDMVAWYSQDFGGILLQELDLDSAQIDALVKQVSHDCLPENAAYRYHHFYNNCATKLRDLLDDLVGGALARATKQAPAGRSLRDLIDASMSPWPFAVTRWLVFGLLNWEIDAPATRWEQMFLPWYLSDEVQKLRVNGHPLVLSRSIHQGVEKPAPSLPASGFGVVFGLFLAVLGLVPAFFAGSRLRAGRAAGAVLLPTGLFAGFYGTLLVFSWAVSPYPETAATMTLLLFHPLHWFCAVAAVGLLRDRPWAWRWTVRYLAVGAVVSVVVLGLWLAGVIPQRIWHYAVGTGLFSGALAFSLWRVRTRESRA